MGDLSKNLSRSEFKCPCPCQVDTVDYELVVALQGVVDYFQAKYPDYDVGIHINSGNRCSDYNKTIPSASITSKHTEYRASDFYLYDKKTGNRIPEDDVADYLETKYYNKYGIGRYRGRTHIDTRAQMSRWDRR